MQGRKREALQKLLCKQRMKYVTYKEVFDNRTGTLSQAWYYEGPLLGRNDSILYEKVINGKTMLVYSKTGDVFCELPAEYIKI